MTPEELWKIIRPGRFFPRYAPEVKNYYHKVRGLNGRGNPVDFSDKDKEHIKAGMKRLFADVKKVKL